MKFKEKEYAELRRLGNGAFGETRLIQDLDLNEKYVVKKYNPEFLSKNDQMKFYESFKNEIKIMHRLFHDNIVRIYDFYLYPEANTGYIIMEYIDGVPLDIEIQDISCGLVDEDINSIFEQIVNAFVFLEKHNIVHRDIRESNILVCQGKVKIIDFGLGKAQNTVEIDDFDSFYNVINRKNMLHQPNEFSLKTYTSSTDMFCIAELFKRLLLKFDIVREFKYLDMLNKMMDKNPQMRYSSFETLYLEIEDKKSSVFILTDNDREIFSNFADSLDSLIESFNGTPTIEENPQTIAEKLKKVIDENQFDLFLSDNKLIIEVFISNGSFSYWRRPLGRHSINMNHIIEFYKWFMNFSYEIKKNIIANIHNRLSTISINQTEGPF